MKDSTKQIAYALAYVFGVFIVLNLFMWISKNV